MTSMFVLSEIDLPGAGPELTIEKITRKELASYNQKARVEAIVGSRAMAIDAASMELPALQFVQLTSAGFDGVPLKEYAAKKVLVANAGTVYSVPIAETVVYGMLQMAKRYRKNPNSHRLRLTRGYRYLTELAGKTAVILGAGSIGTEVAKRLSGFGMTIWGYDPYCPEKPEYETLFRDLSSLKKALPQVDFVISTLPDNEETRGMIDKTFLDCLEPKAVLVNVGRKAVIRQEDLYAALKSGRLGGAVLDMFEVFPNPVTNRFRRLKNTIVLPGVAAISQESQQRRNDHILRNLALAGRGEEPAYLINKEK